MKKNQHFSNLDLKNFMDKIKTAEAGHKLDLSSDEDLSLAIMNLISIEEHLFFTGNKTGKIKYFNILNEAREMRKELMKLIVKNPEGELWCTSKHLLAASMRLFEVGTKAQTKGDHKSAHKFFEKSYHLYNLFWGLNLGLVKNVGVSLAETRTKNTPITYKKSDFLGKVSNIIGKILDCCRE
jgi:hypothetical protein